MAKSRYYINLNLLFDYDAIFYSVYNLQRSGYPKSEEPSFARRPGFDFEPAVHAKLLENLNVVKPRSYGISFRGIISQPAD
jgi:hypothetical protein